MVTDPVPKTARRWAEYDTLTFSPSCGPGRVISSGKKKLHSESEAEYWCKRFGVTPAQLRDSVAKGDLGAQGRDGIEAAVRNALRDGKRIRKSK